MSGSGSNLPVRITVEGGAQAEAAFNRVAATGERAMQTVTNSTTQAAFSGRDLRYVVHQAGYQVQDFAVQVQGGTSALTALSQQGSQLLGIFGAGGAVAGAVLTIGLLTYQLIAGRNATEELAEAQKRLEDATKATNELFETQIERVKRLETAARNAVIATSSVAAASLRATQASRAERMNELEPTMEQVRTAQEIDPDTFLPENIRRRASEYYRLQEEIRRTADQLDLLDQTMSGARSGAASGADRDAARELERSLDVRLRIRQDYQTKVENLQRQETLGIFTPQRRQELEIEARRERDEALARLDRQPGGRASGAVDRSDPSGTLDRLRDQRATALQREIDQLTRSVETPIERYQRRLEELTEVALRARSEGNPIPDETISRAADAALADFERLERGVQQTNDISRELGMTFSSAFEDAIVKGKSFSEVLKGIEQDIARIIIRQTITAPLSSAISGAVKNIDFGAIATSLFPGRADGGPVSMGTTYLVGERGPELFTPGASGNITPNHAMGGENSVTFSPTYNIDARNADVSILPRVRAIAEMVSARSLAQFADSIQRGGSAARLVGRR